jgi:hypothetical protein
MEPGQNRSFMVQSTQTRVFVLRKMLKAFFVGCVSYIATDLFLGRAEGGIFTVLISPFFCIYYTVKLFLIATIAGILLLNKHLNRVWFKSDRLYVLLAALSLSIFVIGYWNFVLAYYDRHDQAAAQFCFRFLINPSFVIFLFSICFRPEIKIDHA